MKATVYVANLLPIDPLTAGGTMTTKKVAAGLYEITTTKGTYIAQHVDDMWTLTFPHQSKPDDWSATLKGCKAIAEVS